MPRYEFAASVFVDAKDLVDAQRFAEDLNLTGGPNCDILLNTISPASVTTEEELNPAAVKLTDSLWDAEGPEETRAAEDAIRRYIGHCDIAEFLIRNSTICPSDYDEVQRKKQEDHG